MVEQKDIRRKIIDTFDSLSGLSVAINNEMWRIRNYEGRQGQDGADVIDIAIKRLAPSVDGCSQEMVVGWIYYNKPF